jgi:zinc and cadmium transporter
MLVGDSLHNVGDGILIAATYLSNPALGFVTALSLLFHEVVQEISEFFVLRQAGYDTKHALKLNFLTACTLLIGSIGGYYLLGFFIDLEIPVLGLATGALLAVLLEDLLPHSLEQAKQKNCGHKHLFAAAIGASIMLLIVTLTPGHTHEHVHSQEIVLPTLAQQNEFLHA